MAQSSVGVKAGDILIDSALRTTYRVVRLVGNSLVEVSNIGVAFTNSRVIEASYIARGIAAGKIKRI